MKAKREEVICHMTVFARRIVDGQLDQKFELEAFADGSRELDLGELMDALAEIGWDTEWFDSQTIFPKSSSKPMLDEAQSSTGG